MNLSNKTIVITGASKGLGRETALRLCRQNPDLILIARTKNLLEQIQNEVEAITTKKPLIIQCDVSNESDVKKAAELIYQKYNHIDILINNAGIGIHKNFEELTGEEMRKQFEVNYFGPFYCIKALLPLLKGSNSAYILNINSLVSKISFPDDSIYASTKSALLTFSQGLRREMKSLNVSIGEFFPGLMNTSFQHDRNNPDTAPSFMILDPNKAAAKLEEMIQKRRKKTYMYRWMLFFMKVKQLTA